MGRVTGTTNQPQISAQALLSGASLPFLHFPLQQTPITRFPRSLASVTWGFRLAQLSPRQCTAEAANTARRLLSIVNMFFCELSNAVFIPLYSAIMRSHQEYAVAATCAYMRAIDHSGYRSVLVLTSLANTCAGQSERHSPPAPIRMPDRSSRLSD